MMHECQRPLTHHQTRRTPLCILNGIIKLIKLLVIARLLKDGRFSYPRILKDIEAELRIGSTLRSKLTEDLASIKNRIIR